MLRFLQFATIIDCWANLDAVVCAEPGFQEFHVVCGHFLFCSGVIILTRGCVVLFEFPEPSPVANRFLFLRISV